MKQCEKTRVERWSPHLQSMIDVGSALLNFEPQAWRIFRFVWMTSSYFFEFLWILPEFFAQEKSGFWKKNGKLMLKNTTHFRFSEQSLFNIVQPVLLFSMASGLQVLWWFLSGRVFGTKKNSDDIWKIDLQRSTRLSFTKKTQEEATTGFNRKSPNWTLGFNGYSISSTGWWKNPTYLF